MKQTKSIVEIIKDYWAIILFFVFLIGTCYLIVYRVGSLESKVEKVEQRQTAYNDKVLDEIKNMNTRLSTIEGFLKGKELTLKQ